MSVHLPPEPPRPQDAWHYTPVATGYQRTDWSTPVFPRSDRGPGPHGAIATSVLLGVHFVATVVGVFTGALLQAALRGVFERRGVGYFESGAVASAQLGVIVSQGVVFAASVALTVFLVRRKKTSFFVPLIAIAVGAIIYWSLMIPPLWADHSLGTVA